MGSDQSGRSKASLAARQHEILQPSEELDADRERLFKPGKHTLTDLAQRAVIAKEAGLGKFTRMGTISRDKIGEATASDPDAEFEEAASGASGDLVHRAELERMFGRSLAGVKVYRGRRKQMEALGARAATRRDTIVFAEDSPSLEVEAHEATHYLQYLDSGAGNGPALSDPGDSAEREATQVAETISRGPQPKSEGGEPPLPMRFGAAPKARIHLVKGPFSKENGALLKQIPLEALQAGLEAAKDQVASYLMATLPGLQDQAAQKLASYAAGLMTKDAGLICGKVVSVAAKGLATDVAKQLLSASAIAGVDCIIAMMRAPSGTSLMDRLKIGANAAVPAVGGAVAMTGVAWVWAKYNPEGSDLMKHVVLSVAFGLGSYLASSWWNKSSAKKEEAELANALDQMNSAVKQRIQDEQKVIKAVEDNQAQLIDTLVQDEGLSVKEARSAIESFMAQMKVDASAGGDFMEMRPENDGTPMGGVSIHTQEGNDAKPEAPKTESTKPPEQTAEKDNTKQQLMLALSQMVIVGFREGLTAKGNLRDRARTAAQRVVPMTAKNVTKIAVERFTRLAPKSLQFLGPWVGSALGYAAWKVAQYMLADPYSSREPVVGDDVLVGGKLLVAKIKAPPEKIRDSVYNVSATLISTDPNLLRVEDLELSMQISDPLSVIEFKNLDKAVIKLGAPDPKSEPRITNLKATHDRELGLSVTSGSLLLAPHNQTVQLTANSLTISKTGWLSGKLDLSPPIKTASGEITSLRFSPLYKSGVQEVMGAKAESQKSASQNSGKQNVGSISQPSGGSSVVDFLHGKLFEKYKALPWGLYLGLEAIAIASTKDIESAKGVDDLSQKPKPAVDSVVIHTQEKQAQPSALHKTLESLGEDAFDKVHAFEENVAAKIPWSPNDLLGKLQELTGKLVWQRDYPSIEAKITDLRVESPNFLAKNQKVILGTKIKIVPWEKIPVLSADTELVWMPFRAPYLLFQGDLNLGKYVQLTGMQADPEGGFRFAGGKLFFPLPEALKGGFLEADAKWVSIGRQLGVREASVKYAGLDISDWLHVDELAFLYDAGRCTAKVTGGSIPEKEGRFSKDISFSGSLSWGNEEPIEAEGKIAGGGFTALNKAVTIGKIAGDASIKQGKKQGTGTITDLEILWKGHRITLSGSVTLTDQGLDSFTLAAGTVEKLLYEEGADKPKAAWSLSVKNLAYSRDPQKLTLGEAIIKLPGKDADSPVRATAKDDKQPSTMVLSNIDLSFLLRGEKDPTAPIHAEGAPAKPGAEKPGWSLRAQNLQQLSFGPAGEAPFVWVTNLPEGEAKAESGFSAQVHVDLRVLKTDEKGTKVDVRPAGDEPGAVQAIMTGLNLQGGDKAALSIDKAEYNAGVIRLEEMKLSALDALLGKALPPEMVNLKKIEFGLSKLVYDFPGRSLREGGGFVKLSDLKLFGERLTLKEGSLTVTLQNAKLPDAGSLAASPTLDATVECKNLELHLFGDMKVAVSGSVKFVAGKVSSFELNGGLKGDGKSTPSVTVTKLVYDGEAKMFSLDALSLELPYPKDSKWVRFISGEGQVDAQKNGENRIMTVSIANALVSAESGKLVGGEEARAYRQAEAKKAGPDVQAKETTLELTNLPAISLGDDEANPIATVKLAANAKVGDKDSAIQVKADFELKLGSITGKINTTLAIVGDNLKDGKITRDMLEVKIDELALTGKNTGVSATNVQFRHRNLSIDRVKLSTESVVGGLPKELGGGKLDAKKLAMTVEKLAVHTHSKKLTIKKVGVEAESLDLFNVVKLTKPHFKLSLPEGKLPGSESEPLSAPGWEADMGADKIDVNIKGAELSAGGNVTFNAQGITGGSLKNLSFNIKDSGLSASEIVFLRNGFDLKKFKIKISTKDLAELLPFAGDALTGAKNLFPKWIPTDTLKGFAIELTLDAASYRKDDKYNLPDWSAVHFRILKGGLNIFGQGGSFDLEEKKASLNFSYEGSFTPKLQLPLHAGIGLEVGGLIKYGVGAELDAQALSNAENAIQFDGGLKLKGFLDAKVTFGAFGGIPHVFSVGGGVHAGIKADIVAKARTAGQFNLPRQKGDGSGFIDFHFGIESSKGGPAELLGTAGPYISFHVAGFSKTFAFDAVKLKLAELWAHGSMQIKKPAGDVDPKKPSEWITPLPSSAEFPRYQVQLVPDLLKMIDKEKFNSFQNQLKKAQKDEKSHANKARAIEDRIQENKTLDASGLEDKERERENLQKANKAKSLLNNQAVVSLKSQLKEANSQVKSAKTKLDRTRKKETIYRWQLMFAKNPETEVTPEDAKLISELDEDGDEFGPEGEQPPEQTKEQTKETAEQTKPTDEKAKQEKPGLLQKMGHTVGAMVGPASQILKGNPGQALYELTHMRSQARNCAWGRAPAPKDSKPEDRIDKDHMMTSNTKRLLTVDELQLKVEHKGEEIRLLEMRLEDRKGASTSVAEKLDGAEATAADLASEKEYNDQQIAAKGMLLEGMLRKEQEALLNSWDKHCNLQTAMEDARIDRDAERSRTKRELQEAEKNLAACTKELDKAKTAPKSQSADPSADPAVVMESEKQFWVMRVAYLKEQQQQLSAQKSIADLQSADSRMEPRDVVALAYAAEKCRDVVTKIDHKNKARVAERLDKVEEKAKKLAKAIARVSDLQDRLDEEQLKQKDKRQEKLAAEIERQQLKIDTLQVLFDAETAKLGKLIESVHEMSDQMDIKV